MPFDTTQVHKLFEKKFKKIQSYLPGLLITKNDLLNAIKRIDDLINKVSFNQSQMDVLDDKKVDFKGLLEMLEHIITKQCNAQPIDFIIHINKRLNAKFRDAKNCLEIGERYTNREAFTNAIKFFKRQAVVDGYDKFNAKKDYANISDPTKKDQTKFIYSIENYEKAMNEYFKGDGLAFEDVFRGMFNEYYAPVGVMDAGTDNNIRYVELRARYQMESVDMLIEKWQSDSLIIQYDMLIIQYENKCPVIATLLVNLKKNNLEQLTANPVIFDALTNQMSNLANYETNKSIQPIVEYIHDPKNGVDEATKLALENAKIEINPIKCLKEIFINKLGKSVKEWKEYIKSQEKNPDKLENAKKLISDYMSRVCRDAGIDLKQAVIKPQNMPSEQEQNPLKKYDSVGEQSSQILNSPLTPGGPSALDIVAKHGSLNIRGKPTS